MVTIRSASQVGTAVARPAVIVASVKAIARMRRGRAPTNIPMPMPIVASFRLISLSASSISSRTSERGPVGDVFRGAAKARAGRQCLSPRLLQAIHFAVATLRRALLRPRPAATTRRSSSRRPGRVRGGPFGHRLHVDAAASAFAVGSSS